MNHKSDEDLIVTLKGVSSLPYSQQYGRWTYFLSELQSNQSSNYSTYLTMFLELFPFNFVYWQKKISLSKQNLIEAYTIALTKNPKSTELWKLYIEQIKREQDPIKYKKQLQKAISEVGPDLHSAHFFEQYYQLLQNTNAKYEFFKKMFTRPLLGLQNFFTKFNQWLQTLNQTQLKAIYFRQTKQDKGVDYQQYIRTEIQRVYKQTLAYRQKRIEIQNQIKYFYFNDDPDRPKQLQIWRKYIYLQRSYRLVQNISYCYQRALLSHTQVVELWEQVFYYLENQTGKYLNVLNILRSHRQFFLNFDSKIYYYWCDLQERQNLESARAMYTKLQYHKKIGDQSPDIQLHPFFRHIQMQIRHDNLTKAKQLYDQLLRLSQNNSQIICYIVVQYANFIVTKFRQMQFAKKLYQSYFEVFHYNRQLFLSYLQFLRYYQNNQGYYDQLMATLIQGYSKAVKISSKEAKDAMELIKHHLRTSLGSINLIKLSEKRLYQLTEQTQQNQQINQSNQ